MQAETGLPPSTEPKSRPSKLVAEEQSNPIQDRLAVVFAPGLWPFRSDQDALSWLLGEGVARGLSTLAGVVGYATPRARVDLNRNEGPFRVYRSLPPNDVVRSECTALAADWAITGRILRDKKGFEIWLNLFDGSGRSLLWTERVFSPYSKFLWRFTYLVRQLISRGIGDRTSPPIELNDLFATGSYEAMAAYARAYGLRAWWRGDTPTGIEIVRAASRAAALDYSFSDAADLMLGFGLELIGRIDRIADAEALRDAVIGDSDFEPANRMRRAIHEHHLALAERAKQT